MFERFEEQEIETEGAKIHLRQYGDGPPLLLLHGFPQTHVAWHQVAPEMARRFSVVVADLRGYGDSVGPSAPGMIQYSNREMAGDMVEVMKTLGYEQFAIAGHDRGGRVSYRLALDHPENVTKIAVLDMIPNVEKVEQFNCEMAKAAFHWFFLAQPHPFPERLLGNDPDFFIETILDRWAGDGVLTQEAIAEYRRCFRDRGVIRAICADYRAGLSVDLNHDHADREAGHRIGCPLLSLWGADGKSDLLPIWERWATEVTGTGLNCGHFLMEEAPDATAQQLKKFFAS